MDTEDTAIRYKKIFLLWLPLALMWIFMAFEQPGVNAMIARLSSPKLNLAAYGVMFPLALIIESPIIQMLAAATALSDGRRNYRRLLKYMHKWAIGLTAAHILIALTPIYGIIVGDLLGVPENIIERSRIAFLIMIPWAASVGYRRLWQGVLIRYGKTAVISYTMVFRLFMVLLTLFAASRLGWTEGAYVGAAALIVGVVAAMIVSYLFARPVIRDLKEEEDSEVISRKGLVSFYIPLILTSTVTFLARPVLNYGIARAVLPLESLAVWPVVMSVLFIFRSLALAYQEVVVALLKEGAEKRRLFTFSALLAGGVAVLFLLFSLSPAGNFWFDTIAGLSEELLPLTFIPTLIVVSMPVVSAFISWFRGLFIYSGETGKIAKAVIVNTASLLLMVYFLPRLIEINGAILAAGIYSLSLIFELSYLTFVNRRKPRFS